MDLEQLKEKLDTEEFDALKKHVDDLTGQRDQARDESINKRKTLKTENEKLKQTQADLMERLGLESIDDLEQLPDLKGAAESEKQYQARIKRMERDMAERDEKIKDLDGRYRGQMLDVQLSRALGKHEFLDTDLVGDYLKARVVWEEDSPMVEADGKTVPLEEGAAWLAQTKPHLLKAAGAGGSGHVPKGGKPNGKNPWARESLNLTEQARILRENPELAERLKAEAGK